MRPVVLAALALLAGCRDDKPERAALPDPVAETRAAILEAADDGDYDALRPLIQRRIFRSDDTDPVAGWKRLGDKPLRTMGVLLRMSRQVRATNEGTLYEWPRFGPNSEPGDMTADERKQLRQVMTEAEVADAILPEVGYTAPRLGILADGTWWFFVLERAP
jgi:hypothetical protein